MKMIEGDGICIKCVEVKPVNHHHILPLEFFGKKKNKFTFLLCQDCHKEVQNILGHKKQTREEFFEIHQIWLRSGKNGK